MCKASQHSSLNLQHTQTYAHATHRLVLSSSSESIKLLDSSSLLNTVDALSGGSPRSRRRSPLGCPLVREAIGTAGWELVVGLQQSQNEDSLCISNLCNDSEPTRAQAQVGTPTQGSLIKSMCGVFPGAWSIPKGYQRKFGVQICADTDTVPSSRFRRRARSRR